MLFHAITGKDLRPRFSRTRKKRERRRKIRRRGVAEGTAPHARTCKQSSAILYYDHPIAIYDLTDSLNYSLTNLDRCRRRAVEAAGVAGAAADLHAAPIQDPRARALAPALVRVPILVRVRVLLRDHFQDLVPPLARVRVLALTRDLGRAQSRPEAGAEV